MQKRTGILLLCMLVILVFWLYQTQNKQIEWLDIDSDNIAERFELRSGQLQIFKQTHLIFSSDITFSVNAYAYGDANNDGINELLVGFWRKGDYGVANNFARQRRDPADSYHLYLYQYQPAAMVFRLIWGSSTLNDPLYDFSLVASGTDNTILRVTTGSYADYDQSGRIIPVNTSDWIWDQWYFKLL